MKGRYGKTAFGLAANEYSDEQMRDMAVLLAGGRTSGDLPGAGDLLDRAAVRGWTEVADGLLKHGVPAKSEAGSTALLDAARYGRTDIVRLLLNAGADPDGRPSTPTPLQAVLGYGYEPSDAKMDAARRRDIVGLLVAKGATVRAGADILNPLSRALFYLNPPDLGVAALLIAHGADVNGADASGYSYLHLARMRGEPSLVSFLLKYGARDAVRR